MIARTQSGSFAGLADAAKQQGDLIFFIGKSLEEHEKRLEDLTVNLNDLASQVGAKVDLRPISREKNSSLGYVDRPGSLSDRPGSREKKPFEGRPFQAKRQSKGAVLDDGSRKDRTPPPGSKKTQEKQERRTSRGAAGRGAAADRGPVDRAAADGRESQDYTQAAEIAAEQAAVSDPRGQGGEYSAPREAGRAASVDPREVQQGRLPADSPGSYESLPPGETAGSESGSTGPARLAELAEPTGSAEKPGSAPKDSPQARGAPAMRQSPQEASNNASGRAETEAGESNRAAPGQRQEFRTQQVQESPRGHEGYPKQDLPLAPMVFPEGSGIDEAQFNDELDRRFEEFSNYVQEEMRRLDEEISEEVDNRVQAVTDTLPDIVSTKMRQYQADMEALIDRKMRDSMGGGAYGDGMLGLEDLSFLQPAGAEGAPQTTFQGAPQGTPQVLEDSPLGVPQGSPLPGQKSADQFQSGSLTRSSADQYASGSVAGQSATGGRNSQANSERNSSTTPAAADAFDDGYNAAGGPGRADSAGPGRADSAGPGRGRADSGAAAGRGGPTGAAGAGIQEERPFHGSAPDEAVVAGPQGRNDSSASSGATAAAPRPYPPAPVRDNPSQVFPQARAQPDPELVKAIRMIHQDVKTRLPQVEESLAELKPLRLQMPALQQDLENLSASVAQLAQIIEEDNIGVMPEESHGRNSSSGGHPDIMRQTTTEETDSAADGSNEDVFVDPGATAGAHSPEAVNEAPRGRPSIAATAAVNMRDRRTSVMGQAKLGSIVGAYMQPPPQANPRDQIELEQIKKRTTKLEEKSKKVDKISDLEQLVVILEDRVKELDAEYRAKSKVVDIKLGLLSSEAEKEEMHAKKVYSSWNLGDQVDVIQSVVAQEMRSVKVDLDSQIRIMLQGMTGPTTNAPRQSVAPHRDALMNQSQRRDSPRSRSNSPSSNIHEMEEKVKRLQECYQQCTLKIAGLKSANRHSEQQVSMALDQMKKMSGEVEGLYDNVLRTDCRLDYFVVNLKLGEGLEGVGEQHFKDLVAGAPAPLAKQHPRGSFSQGAPLNLQVPSSTPPPHAHHRHRGGGAEEKPGGSPRARDEGTHTPKGSDGPRLSTRPRRMSSGAVNKDNAAGSTTSSPPGEAAVGGEQLDLNTGRIWRLGKKITEVDAEMSSQSRALRDELELVAQKITMMITFLPRKQRRMVERLLTSHKHEEKDDEDKHEKKDVGRRVSFSEKPADIRTFNVEHDSHQVPWQVVGEPDPKWHWCLQPRNEMGRDLARYFEQLEHERDELSETLTSRVDTLREELMMRVEPMQYGRHGIGSRGGGESLSPLPSSLGERGATPLTPKEDASRTSWGASTGQVTAGGAEALSLSRRLEKVLIPQLGTLEDRVERLVKDMSEVKKNLDIEEKKKVDREEFQLVAMRLAVFEKFDPKQVATQIENLEVDGKHYMHLIGQLGEQIRKVEGYAAHRADVTKVRGEVAGNKMEIQKVQGDLKETASTVFHGNRQVTNMVIESKTAIEKSISRLELEKVQIADYATLYEKVLKLESSMRDNRQILSDHGGQELSSVVKRIILNMEDKIMVLEKKVDCLADGRPFDSDAGDAIHQVRTTTTVTQVSTDSEAIVQNLSNEISTLTSTMTQLKQDVNLSKVSMESIMEQGHQSLELANRLQLSVDTGGEGEEGTTLSLSRVQVMVAAAARQLVAGSKWITKEMFDLRVTEMRREYLAGFRQLQEVVEHVQSAMKGAARKLPAVDSTADKASLLMKRGGDQDDVIDWPAGGFDVGWNKAGGRHITTVKDRPATTALASLPTSRSIPRPPHSARTHDRR